jgi:hypothetical protein
MLTVGLALLEREPVRPREAPVSFAYEKWVAAASHACATAAGTSPAGPSSATNATARGLLASHILTIADAPAQPS